MSSGQNKQIVSRYVELFNAGEMKRIFDELCTPDVKIHGVLGSGGRDIALPIWNELHGSLAMKLAVVEMAGEGETVAVLLKDSGNFQAPFRGMPGIPPNGNPYEVPAMEWFHFRDGKISERWGARDSGSIIRQLSADIAGARR